MTILEAIREVLSAGTPTHLQELYQALPDTLEHSIRARIYENLGKHFRRISQGVYVAIEGDAACVVVSGDALEEIRKMPSGSFDALITDPAYPWLNAHLKKGTSRKTKGAWSFKTEEINTDLALEMWRVLKKGAHAFFFVPALSKETIEPFTLLLDKLKKCGFTFNKLWVWDKVSIGMGYRGRARHEGILFMSKGRPRQACDRSIPDVLAHKSIHPYHRIHETEKPVSLLEAIIRFATNVKDTILDCYAGSCSTGVAALKLGRNAVLVERELALQTV